MAVVSDRGVTESASDLTADNVPPDFAELKAAHCDLVTKCLTVLGEASTWGEGARPGAPEKPLPDDLPEFAYRMFVNRLVQAHIKKRLRLLSEAYSQLNPVACD